MALAGRDAWTIAVTTAFQETLSYTVSDLEIEAASQVMAGHAADLSGYPAKHVCLSYAACRLALDGYQVHMICLEAQLASHRQSTMANLIHSLGLRSACVTNEMGPEDRDRCYEADVVFGAASELALDRLRRHYQSGDTVDPVGRRLGFLQQKDSTDQSRSRRQTFLLIEDIEVTLVELAMTPVQLHDDAEENEVVAASSFYRLFSDSAYLGGVGTVIDKRMMEGLSLYGIKTWRPAIRPSPSPAPDMVLLTADESALILHVRRRAREAANLGQRLVVEGCPAGSIESIELALAEDVLDAVIVTPATALQSLSAPDPDSPPNVLLLEKLIGDIIEPDVGLAFPLQTELFLISLSASDSWRSEYGQRLFMRCGLKLTGHERMVVTDTIIANLPALVRGLFKILPDHLKKAVIRIMLKHTQQETDRHRYRSMRAVMEYDREIGDLVAYAGA